MNYTMENEFASVKINSLGAELASFILKKDGTEYIWQADSAVWARHAPILFPVVGKLKNNQYQIKNQTYSMPQHGFARDLPFELLSLTENSCNYLLRSNRETLAMYPYHFELTVSYRLEKTTLTVSYRVQNKGEDTMHFSIGAHPAFNWPLSPETETRKNYVLEFSDQETLNRLVIENGLISPRRIPFLKDASSFPLTAELFTNDALVFQHIKSSKITFLSQEIEKYVEMDITGFPYLGIWAKPASPPFICLEPWYGLADSIDSDGDLSTKTAIQTLTPNQAFSCVYTITIG